VVCVCVCVCQLTNLSSSSGRSYTGYTGGYRSNYDAASRTFGGASSAGDRGLGYLSTYGGVSSLKEKFDRSTSSRSAAAAAAAGAASTANAAAGYAYSVVASSWNFAKFSLDLSSQISPRHLGRE